MKQSCDGRSRLINRAEACQFCAEGVMRAQALLREGFVSA